MTHGCDRQLRFGVLDKDELRRTPAGLGEYVEALAQGMSARSIGHLVGAGDELGQLLLGLSARQLAALGIYDAMLAGEAYLRTAHRALSAQHLLELLSYRASPATAARAVLAAVAEPTDRLVERLIGVSADGDEPATFEVAVAATAVARNAFRLGRVSDHSIQRVLVDPRSTRVAANLVVVLEHPPTSTRVASRIRAVDPWIGRDQEVYAELVVDGVTTLLASAHASTVALSALSLSGRLTPFAPTNVINPTSPHVPIANIESGGQTVTRMLLNDAPTALTIGSLIVVEAEVLHVAEVKEVRVETATTPDGTLIPAARVDIVPALPSSIETTTPEIQFALKIHYNTVPLGPLVSPAKVDITSVDLSDPSGVPLLGPLEPLAPEDLPSEVILEDANGKGALAKARIEIDDDGDGRLFLQDADAFAGTMRAPITVYGNVLHATHGETVEAELLGSGDGSLAFQTFALERSPLTYLSDAHAPRGVRSTLQIRVDGFEWQEVPSFFATEPDDRVYIVRHDQDGATQITFGDGTRGERLPSGVDNVVATYRFGAGAKKPPAGALRQLVRPVPGIRRVVSPVAPWGGSDAESAAQLRRSAPRSAPTLGRAVSIGDFEALALAQPAVVNAAAKYAWDESAQRAAVRVWIVSDGASVAADVAAYLTAQAGPDVPIQVSEATLVLLELAVDVATARGHDPHRVSQAIIHVLAAGEDAPLSLTNAPIGRPLFRSAVTSAVHTVAGIDSIRALNRAGVSMPTAVTVAEGEVLDARGLVVNGIIWPQGGAP